ncbi:hypothetical protein [Nocardia cyriacigeorgica]|uniref:hypothetical protein n=1 Tax=Nocardia cyriacigeorgica TaxID=135487 RepID=UPI0024565661|nr:hypothetical protein [Nocardia cyriacigeorgica]
MQPHISDTALAMLHDRAIAVVDRFAAELPLYEGLPQSLIEGDFLHGSRLNVELFFAYLRTGRLPDETDTREIVDLAAARVRDGAPLAEVLTNYRIGASVLRTQLAESGSSEDVEILREVTEPLIQYLLTVTGRIAVAAADGAHDPGWEQSGNTLVWWPTHCSTAPIRGSGCPVRRRRSAPPFTWWSSGSVTAIRPR